MCKQDIAYRAQNRPLESEASGIDFDEDGD